MSVQVICLQVSASELQAVSLAGGLTSTSSCIFNPPLLALVQGDF